MSSPQESEPATSDPPTPATSATPEATNAAGASQGPHKSQDAYARLPFHRVFWQDQKEIELALPLAMKYGRVKERRADVWIYLTRTTQTLIFHSYRLDGEPDGIHIVDEILEKAKPCFAFKLAKTPKEILALATYYFIRKGLASNYDMSLTPDQASLLSTLCKSKRSSKVVILRLRNTAKETPTAAQEPIAQPAQEPIVHSALEPNAQPAQEPDAQPAQEPIAQPAQEPIAQPAQEPIVHSALEPNAQSTQEPDAQSTQEPDAQFAQEPIVQSAQVLEEFSSRVTSPAQTEEMASLPTENNEIQQVLKVEPIAIRLQNDPPIERYLDLEDEEKDLSEELDRYNFRVMALRGRLMEVQASLEKEEGEAAKVADRKDKSQAEKKRLWDAMSKEDVRELGRRDSQRKRQKPD